MFGVALWGLIPALLVLLPNLSMLVWKPRGVPEGLRPEPRLLLTMERAGQVGCLLFTAFEIGPFRFGFPSAESGVVWLLLSAAILLCYYLLWLRYYLKGRRFARLYDTVVVPVPMAVLPACFFLATGLLELHAPLISAAVLFAVGHVPLSWRVHKQLAACADAGER